jgi:hypothetical protein
LRRRPSYGATLLSAHRAVELSRAVGGVEAVDPVEMRLRIIFMGTGRPQGEHGARVADDVAATHWRNCYIYVYHLVYSDVFVGQGRQAGDFGGNSTRLPQRTRWTMARICLGLALPQSPNSYMIVDTHLRSNKYV